MLLEGLEVAFIVLTFGANQHRVGLAAAAAGVAVLFVVLAGLAARAPLARVPENTMKFAVGVMLSSFGMFWGAEGAGAGWPGGEAALLVIVPCVLLFAVAAARWLASRPLAGRCARRARRAAGERAGARLVRQLEAALRAVWEFVVGDDWRTAAGVVAGALADGRDRRRRRAGLVGHAARRRRAARRLDPPGAAPEVAPASDLAVDPRARRRSSWRALCGGPCPALACER